MLAADWIQLLGVGIALLSVLGAGIRFLWNKVEKRFMEIEKRLQHCDDEWRKSERRRGILWTIVMLMKQELKRIEPSSPALTEADNLIHEYHDAHSEDMSALERAILRLSSGRGDV